MHSENQSNPAKHKSPGYAKDISVEDRKRIIQELRIDLVQCGWRDEMQARAIEIVKQNSGGLSVLTMEELFMEIVKDGKTLVPDDVKALVIDKVKESIQSKSA